ncbi:hypothetical protein [Paraburkholderia caballeronis]|uniref:hypothetical protein n=1 Tax=Paraburkholderia caballeronis TaxID=416943 RepID=UPI00143115DF|nr:hypothetical protein [Paraburkholderia caballeronis]
MQIAVGRGRRASASTTGGSGGGGGGGGGASAVTQLQSGLQTICCPAFFELSGASSAVTAAGMAANKTMKLHCQVPYRISRPLRIKHLSAAVIDFSAYAQIRIWWFCNNVSRSVCTFTSVTTALEVN